MGGGGSGTAGGELLFDKSWWSLTDRMGSVLGLVADSASGGGADWSPSERVEYSPYGRPRTLPRADAGGNGVVDFADISAIYASYGKMLGQTGYKARADLSADGAVGYSDISAVWASWGLAEQTDTLWSSGFEGASGGAGGVGHGCDVGYAGALWDPDLGLWQMRRRCYDPVLGRWLTRDPAGYVDGMSLYAYVRSRPLMYYDPFGMEACGFWDILSQLPGAAAGILWDDGSKALEGAYQLAEEAVVDVGFGVGLVSEETLMERSGLASLTADIETRGAGEVAADVATGVKDAAVDFAEGVGRGDPEVIGGALRTFAYSALGGAALRGLQTAGAAAEAGEGVAANSIRSGGRLGSASTRAHVAETQAELRARGWKVERGGTRGEEYIPGPGGSRAGSAYPDITAVKNGRTLRINTIDTLSDGVTPTAREAANAAKIRALKPDDHLLLVPKP